MKTACVALIALVVCALPAPAGQAVATDVSAKLEGITVDINLKGATLTAAVDTLRQTTGLNFVVDPAVFEAKADADFKIDLQLKGVKAQSALNLLCSLYNLVCGTADEAVIITLPGRLIEEPIITVYDVFDLTEIMQPRSYSRDPARGGSPYRWEPIYAFIPPYLYFEYPYAYNQYIDRFEDKPVISPEALMKVIMDTVPADWSKEAGTGMGYANGELIVRQTPAVQLEIAQLLHRMRIR